MKHLFLLLVMCSLFHACTNKKKKWSYLQTINLGDITPIGFAFQNEEIWISDGDHNQIIAVNSSGEVLQKITDAQRPMHIDIEQGDLYIPEYGSDQIIKVTKSVKSIVKLPDSLDAPAGVDRYKTEIALADFYHHRVLYFNGNEWITIGKKGNELGELNYPTDVQILKDKIVVADAYNNRIQIFDKQGIPQQLIGLSEGINAATGVFATEDEIFVTDFENNRVLAYHMKGELKQIITEKINKPTDVLLKDDVLYISNYKGKNIVKMGR